MRWMSSGGGSVSAVVRAIFADPWPADVVASCLHTLHRRLLSAPAAAPLLLSCAAAAVAAAPSRVRQEQLHAMWDVCLRWEWCGVPAVLGPCWTLLMPLCLSISSSLAAHTALSLSPTHDTTTPIQSNRANTQGIKLAGLQAALCMACAPTPAVAAPPSAAAPEVKAFAAKEEAAMISMSRCAHRQLCIMSYYKCLPPGLLPPGLLPPLHRHMGGTTTTSTLLHWCQRCLRLSAFLFCRNCRCHHCYHGCCCLIAAASLLLSLPYSSAVWWLGENANFGAGEYAWQPAPLPPALLMALQDADSASQERLVEAAATMNPVMAMLLARLQRLLVSGSWEIRVAAAQVRQCCHVLSCNSVTCPATRQQTDASTACGTLLC